MRTWGKRALVWVLLAGCLCGLVPLPQNVGEGRAMTGGTGSTLIMHPRGLSDLTMGLTAGEPYEDTSPYVAPLQYLDLHEDERWQVIYEQAPPGEGGSAVRPFAPLVPLSFWVIIKSQTRAGMITAYNDLKAACTNVQGGTIEYKPEDLGVGVLSTFYHYVQSAPPSLLRRPGNRWDAPAKSDGYFTIYVGVNLLTQPIATSDPDSPTTLAELSTTIDNWEDAGEGQTNKVTVTAANVKGSMPALVRLKATPASGDNMARLIVFKRDEASLANFASILEAESAEVIYPSVAWSVVDDADRGSGQYQRCLPSTDANGEAQGLRFTIPSPDDQHGRFAVFGVAYDDTYGASGEVITEGRWTHQVKVRVGNIIQEGRSDYKTNELHRWTLLYAGEFELPPTLLSGSVTGYDEGPYIEWYATRESGFTEFRLDAIILVYVGDSRLSPTALDVPCADAGGLMTADQLLMENFPGADGQIQDLSQVVTLASGYFKYALTTAPRGDFMMLSPSQDTLLTAVRENHSGGTVLDDDFGGYKGSRWLQLADFETDETWTADLGTTGADTTQEVEGGQGRYNTSETVVIGASQKGTIVYTVSLDLDNDGRFTDDDYVVWRVYVDNANDIGTISVWLLTSDPNYYGYTVNSGITTGVNWFIAKKSDFAVQGSPDWTDINEIGLDFTVTDDVERTIRHDWLRIEKADPGDATNPNPTGIAWDFQPVGGAWSITEDVSGAGATLACLDIESGVEKVALIAGTTPADVLFRARVQAKRDSGYTGIVWRAGPDTLVEGAEDCYAALLDPTNDKLLVREYNAGAVTLKDDPALVSTINDWFVIGVMAKGDTFYIYAVDDILIDDDDDVFSEVHLKATFTDATHTTGKCGVMSISTLGRFDEVKLVGIADNIVPADQLTLSGQAIFRTIVPFNE